jgi:hypothetical protein
MIVLHKDHRLHIVAHLFEHRVRKPPVDELIALPVCRTKDGPGMRDVTKRPKSLVGEALVVARLFLLRERGSSGGTRKRSNSSTAARSASPVPLATQTPSHARRTGSSAVTRPLGGTTQAISRPWRMCM